MNPKTQTYYFTASIIRGYSCMGGSCWGDVNFEVALSDDQVSDIREFYRERQSDCDYTELKDAHPEIYNVFDEALREVFACEVGPSMEFEAEFYFPPLFLTDGQGETDYTEFEEKYEEEEYSDYDFYEDEEEDEDEE